MQHFGGRDVSGTASDCFNSGIIDMRCGTNLTAVNIKFPGILTVFRTSVSNIQECKNESDRCVPASLSIHFTYMVCYA